eukprot:gene18238-biopygen27190
MSTWRIVSQGLCLARAWPSLLLSSMKDCAILLELDSFMCSATTSRAMKQWLKLLVRDTAHNDLGSVLKELEFVIDLLSRADETTINSLKASWGRTSPINHHLARWPSREIQAAVRLALPGEPANDAVSEGTKAVNKFNSA